MHSYAAVDMDCGTWVLDYGGDVRLKSAEDDASEYQLRALCLSLFLSLSLSLCSEQTQQTQYNTN